MQLRALGSQGLKVSALGLGCMAMTEIYGAVDDRESIATVQRALDRGVTLFDTAEAYGPYTNEELLGRALRGRRDQAVIATKFGFTLTGGQITGVDSRPQHIRAVAHASLKRLGTEWIDLFYQHRVDPAVPIEEVAGAVRALVDEGKVRYFGLSEAGIANIRRAHAVCPVSALQSEYSLWERNLEPAVIPALRELNIGLVAFCPLGRGFLTGAARRGDQYDDSDFRHVDPRFRPENFEANMRAVAALRALATQKGATAAQVALAWLLHRGPNVVPIPGTKRRKYLDENVGAAAVELSAADLAALETAFRPEAISGPRYDAENMAYVDR